MSAASDAISNNEQLFQKFAKLISSGDFANYQDTTERLAGWLNNERAYYPNARPQILHLLEVAEEAAYRAIGGDLTHIQTMHTALQCASPAQREWVTLYEKVLLVVAKFVDLFQAKDQAERLTNLLARHRSTDAARPSNISQQLAASEQRPYHMRSLPYLPQMAASPIMQWSAPQFAVAASSRPSSTHASAPLSQPSVMRRTPMQGVSSRPSSAQSAIPPPPASASPPNGGYAWYSNAAASSSRPSSASGMPPSVTSGLSVLSNAQLPPQFFPLDSISAPPQPQSISVPSIMRPQPVVTSSRPPQSSASPILVSPSTPSSAVSAYPMTASASISAPVPKKRKKKRKVTISVDAFQELLQEDLNSLAGAVKREPEEAALPQWSETREVEHATETVQRDVHDQAAAQEPPPAEHVQPVIAAENHDVHADLGLGQDGAQELAAPPSPRAGSQASQLRPATEPETAPPSAEQDLSPAAQEKAPPSADQDVLFPAEGVPPPVDESMNMPTDFGPSPPMAQNASPPTERNSQGSQPSQEHPLTPPPGESEAQFDQDAATATSSVKQRPADPTAAAPSPPNTERMDMDVPPGDLPSVPEQSPPLEGSTVDQPPREATAVPPSQPVHEPMDADVDVSPSHPAPELEQISPLETVFVDQPPQVGQPETPAAVVPQPEDERMDMEADAPPLSHATDETLVASPTLQIEPSVPKAPTYIEIKDVGTSMSPSPLSPRIARQRARRDRRASLAGPLEERTAKIGEETVGEDVRIASPVLDNDISLEPTPSSPVVPDAPAVRPMPSPAPPNHSMQETSLLSKHSRDPSPAEPAAQNGHMLSPVPFQSTPVRVKTQQRATASSSSIPPLSNISHRLDMIRKRTRPTAVRERGLGEEDSLSVTPVPQSQISLFSSPSNVNPPGFGAEMVVLAVQRGLTGAGIIRVEVRVDEVQLATVSRWNARATTADIWDALCITLGCYPSDAICEAYAKDAAEGLAVQPSLFTRVACAWPASGRASIRLPWKDQITELSLSPPFIITPDNLMDLSMFVPLTPGTFAFEIVLTADVRDRTFVLHAHHPTEAQRAQVRRCGAWADGLLAPIINAPRINFDAIERRLNANVGKVKAEAANS